ncbi:MAG: VCBS repeat-containing protein, partial [Bacteroidota bacterium]
MRYSFDIAFASVALVLFYAFRFGSSLPSISYVESSSGLQSIALDGGRTEIEMADINDDGNIDLLSIGDHGNPFVNTQEHGIMVWFGNGTAANWTLFQNGNFGYGGIAIGDVDNDGKLDVGYGMHHNYSSSDFGNQLLEVALGDGSGQNWTPWDDSLATRGETWGMFSTDFGDVDNDGWLDVGSVSFGCCAGIHVYRNLGNGTWQQSYGFTGGNSAMDFIFGDMNGDGNLDFAVAHQAGTPYFGDGSGNFTLRHNNLPAPVAIL